MVEPRFLVLDDHVAASIQRAIDRTFSTSFRMPAHVDVWRIGRDIDLDFRARHAAKITLTSQGVPFGSFIAAFHKPLLLQLLNAEATQMADAMIDDAAGEITNMLFGVFKTDVNGAGCGLTMGVPEMIHEEQMTDSELVGSEKLCLDYSAGDHKAWVAIAQYH